MRNRLLAEFLGTAGLLIVVVGSGIMGENLAQGNLAIALLANSLATGAGLYALIATFGPISGAHFNPAISFSEFLSKKLSAKELALYSSTQVFGGIFGVIVTHTMFGQQLLQLSGHDRSDLRYVFSELVATAGLLFVISLSGKQNADRTPVAVATYITAAYWCTSSTSFANPAVTIARMLTNTFSGISPFGVLPFIAAQVIGVFVVFMALKNLKAVR